MEEILLLYQNRLGEGAPYTLSCNKRRGDLNVRLSVAGESLDPFSQGDIIVKKLGRQFRNDPLWEYKGGCNQVLFTFTLYNTTRKNILFSWKYTRNSRGQLAFSVICQILGAALGIVAPVVSARIIVAYTNNEADRVIYIALVLLGVQILRNLFVVLSNIGYNRAYTGTLNALERDIVDNVLRIESQCLDEKGSGLFIQRITTDTARIASGFNSIADMISQIFNYTGVLIAMFLVDPMIALVVVVTMGSQCAMELWRTKRLYADDRIYRASNRRVQRQAALHAVPLLEGQVLPLGIRRAGQLRAHRAAGVPDRQRHADPLPGAGHIQLLYRAGAQRREGHRRLHGFHRGFQHLQ